MDVEKLIERLKAKDFERYYDCTPFECGVFGLLEDTATALSTLQAENTQLRAYLEYEREHANAYYEECGQWEVENEKLRAELERVKLVRCKDCKMSRPGGPGLCLVRADRNAAGWFLLEWPAEGGLTWITKDWPIAAGNGASGKWRTPRK